MSISAMKQALEALEWDADYDTSVTLQKAAITALRQAIAEAEKQEPAFYVVPATDRFGEGYEQTFWEDPAGFPVYTKPVVYDDDIYDIWVEQGTCQQNRQVAMRRTTRDEKIVNPGVYEVPVHASDMSQERVDETPKCKDDPRAPHGFDRNASHSADRYVCECEGWEPPMEWVGLTKDEVDSWELPVVPTVFEFAKFVEAKLKEKNNG